MSLTNPNLPVTEERLKDFYEAIKPYLGGGYSAGDGIEISNGEISTDNLQSGDMGDVVTPLPAVTTRKEFIKYSTDEQIVGEWIDGSPVYEKYFTGISQTLNVENWKTIATIPNCKEVIEIQGYYYNSGLAHNNYLAIKEVEVLPNGNVTVLGFQNNRTMTCALMRYIKTTT